MDERQPVVTDRWRWCPCVKGEQGERSSAEAPWKGTMRILGAEAAGTLLLVLLTCLPQCSVSPTSPPLAGFASGLVVAVLVQGFDHISGAMFNPTVTLAALIYGKLSCALAAMMVVAQVGGAVCGAALLHAAHSPLSAVPSSELCMTLPAPHVAPYLAAAIEAALGGCLALVNCAAWDSRNRRLLDSIPLRIGITVSALSMQANQLTGASMNPVRSLGPALLADNWTHHWVYWAGPLGGCLLATTAYVRIWRRSGPARGASTPPLSRRGSASIQGSLAKLGPA